MVLKAGFAEDVGKAGVGDMVSKAGIVDVLKKSWLGYVLVTVTVRFSDVRGIKAVRKVVVKAGISDCDKLKVKVSLTLNQKSWRW